MRTSGASGIGIGKDKPGVVWDDIDGHARGYGKVEFVAMGAVFPLFGIGAKIGDGGFDLERLFILLILEFCALDLVSPAWH